MIKLIDEITEEDQIITILMTAKDFNELSLHGKPIISIGGEIIKCSKILEPTTIYSRKPNMLTVKIRVKRDRNPQRHAATSEVLVLSNKIF